MAIVQTGIAYSYGRLREDLDALRVCYPWLETGTAGQSLFGRELYYLRLGDGPRRVFYHGAHHAIEWITSPLLMKFAENYLAAFAGSGSLHGYPAHEVWRRSSIYLLPMVNPDGVDLVLGEFGCADPRYRAARALQRGAKPLENVWKANGRGVDLNLNYPAGWEWTVRFMAEQRIDGPAPSDYAGPAPLSEPESQAVARFTEAHDFQLVLAFHSQGEVIYWQYGKRTPADARPIAEQMARVSGYVLEGNPADAVGGGYKDWFIERFGRPGFTVEVGWGENPLPIKQFAKIYRDCEELLLVAALG